MRQVTHWINGKPWSGTAQRQGDVFDPATGQVQARADFATSAEVDLAVGAASAAWPAWRDTSLARRTAILFRFRELLAARREELTGLISSEHGKVRADAAGELDRGIEVAEFACGIAHLLKGEYSENVSTRIDTYSVRQPLGVVAGITPFNFPAMVPMWMFPIAIACGNTFVLKPSEKDPGASVLLAELLAEAGLPDGVFNVVQGDKAAVDAILAHPGIAAVSFVGSTPIARHVYATAAAHGKRVQALGGAKNHMLVLPDADLDAAADAAVSAGYGSAGERCMAVSAVIAVGPAGDELVSRIGQRAQQLVVGPGTDPGAQMGPLITGAHRDRVASYLEPGRTAGGEVLLDGRGLRVAGYEGGFWLGPSLVDKVRPGTPVYDDEVFGPVLCVLRASSFEEGLEIINASPYGNGAAIFTGDGGAARRFGAEVTAGMVGVNVPIPVPMSYYSFGGWKDSLFGDLHIYGPDGVRFYTRGKVTTSRWREPADVNLAFPSSS
ncbi:MAG TPA: CoA-acylating methylmalonate-semialdehyde dehydrogenase [Streptosporangiaceae bacterium]|nr:CoA-acylating methylmalonate-semialdehyde dehydrogenase [Streptosporangiaceae bacterium]